MIRIPTILVTVTGDGAKHRFVPVTYFLHALVWSFTFGILLGAAVSVLGLLAGALAR